MTSIELHYKPIPTFSQLAHEPEAIKLWAFLCRDENLIRADTATLLKKPALEALVPYLLEEFDVFSSDKAECDKYKQLAGSMLRQIMEHRGYQLDRTGVRVLTSELFTTAARYKK